VSLSTLSFTIVNAICLFAYTLTKFFGAKLAANGMFCQLSEVRCANPSLGSPATNS
jgi:hypothetical protein